MIVSNVSEDIKKGKEVKRSLPIVWDICEHIFWS